MTVICALLQMLIRLVFLFMESKLFTPHYVTVQIKTDLQYKSYH